MQPRFIFICAFPGSRKTELAEKLADSLGLVPVRMSELIAAEGNLTSKNSRKERVSLLAKAVTRLRAPGYIITGFLKSLKEALHFEHTVGEISLIINLTTRNQESLLRSQFSAELLVKDSGVLEFYRKFGIVRMIEFVGHIDLIHQRAKAKCSVEVFFVVGAPSSGKTAVAKHIAQKFNMRFVDVASLQDTDAVASTQRVIQMLNESHEVRVILDNFPASLEQLKFFEQAYSMPKQAIGIVVSTEEVADRKPHVLAQVQTYLKKTKLLWEYLASNAYFKVVRSHSDLETCYLSLDPIMQAEFVLVRGGDTTAFSDLLAKAGYEKVDTDDYIRAICQRRTPLGRQIIGDIEQGKMISTDQRTSALQQIVYSSGRYTRKFQMTSEFPQRKAQLELIASKVAPISRVFYLTDTPNQRPVEDLKSVSILTTLQEKLLLQRINKPDSLSLRWLRELRRGFVKKGEYILVMGPQFSGKTTVVNTCKLLGWVALDYETLPEAVRQRKSTEDQAYEDVNWMDIIDEIAYRLSQPGAKLVLDGLPPISLICDDEKNEDEEKTRESVISQFFKRITENLFNALGNPLIIFSLTRDYDLLISRLRKSLDLASDEDETPEEALATLNESVSVFELFEEWFETACQGKGYDASDPLGSVDNWKLRDYYSLPHGATANFPSLYVRQVLAQKVVIVAGEITTSQLIYLRNISINYDLLHLHLPTVLDWARSKLPELLKFPRDQVPIEIQIEALSRYAETNLRSRQQVLLLSGLVADLSESAFPRPLDIFLAVEQSLGSIVGLLSINPVSAVQEVVIERIPVIPQPPPKNPDEPDDIPEPEDPYEQPLRSDPRKTLHFAKLFQVYKRDYPVFLINSKGWEHDIEDFLQRTLTYIGDESFLSASEAVRFKCPNIQVLI